jgi:hypothetical protein
MVFATSKPIIMYISCVVFNCNEYKCAFAIVCMQAKAFVGKTKIKSVLKKNTILFEENPVLPKLKGDTKKYRRPDFFLPEKKIYIEYWSGWYRIPQSLQKRDREQYEFKMDLYTNNKIDCIYLYPDDLPRVEEIIVELIKEIERERKNIKPPVSYIHKHDAPSEYRPVPAHIRKPNTPLFAPGSSLRKLFVFVVFLAIMSVFAALFYYFFTFHRFFTEEYLHVTASLWLAVIGGFGYYVLIFIIFQLVGLVKASRVHE